MTLLLDQESTLARAIERLAPKAKFVELFAETGSGEEARLDTKSTTFSPQPRLRGFAVRAWTGKRWAEAASSEFGTAQLDSTVQDVERDVQRAHGSNPPPGASTTTRGSWATTVKRSLRELGPEGSIGLGKEILGWAKAVPGIGEVQVRLAWQEEERLYLNSAGARCHQRVERTHVTFAPVAMENGRMEYDYFHGGGAGGLEQIEVLDEAKVRSVAQASKELLHAKAPPAGETDVILDPGVTGTFAHESFGHGTEADQFVRDRSYLKPILGQVVGPDTLTIVDDGSFPGGWGMVFADDEGHPGHKTPLIERGRFVGALHDRETAAALGTKATGNTRRADFLSRAFVRMTNTYVAGGDRSLDELVGDVQDGVLLEHWTSGMEDPLGGQMQLKVKKGHRIEHGRVTDLVGAMALSGKVLDFLKGIRGIEKSRTIEIEPGFCGKGHGDYLPVGSGGVHLLSRATVGPA